MKLKILILLMFAGFSASAQFTQFNSYGVQKATAGDSLRLVGSGVGQYLYLPTTKMLRAAILANSLTFNNGLTKTGNNVSLGGIYSGNLVIGEDETGDYLVPTIGLYPSTPSFPTRGGVNFASEWSGGKGTNLDLFNNGSWRIIGWKTPAGDTKLLTGDISFDNTTSQLIIDNDYGNAKSSLSKGIRYKRDYSTGWVVGDSLFLAPKSYVDRAVGSIDLSAYVTKTGTETLTNKTLTAPVINTPDITNGTANSLSLVNGTINATPIGASIPSTGNFTTVNATASSTLQVRSEKGQANGYASLGSDGKVPLTQINDALIGSVSYQGSYNVSTNMPTLPAVAPSNKGWYYVVSDSGIYSPTGKPYYQGDWIISNGSIWDVLNQSNRVSSVNGKVGNVTVDNVPKWSSIEYGGISGSNSISHVYGYDAVTDGKAHLLTLNDFNTTIGIGNGSTLNNSVSGNAGSATNWGGQPADFSGTVGTPYSFMGFNTGGVATQFTTSGAKNLLNLNDGSVLNNDATKWSGLDFSNTISGTPDYLLGYYGSGAAVRRLTLSTLKTALATSLQDVTSVSGVTTNAITAPGLTIKNSGVAKIDFVDGSDDPQGAQFNAYNYNLRLAGGASGLYVKNTGEVGIGTTSPTQKLDVNGNIKSSGAVLGASIVSSSGGASSAQLNNSGQGVFTSTATKTITVDPGAQRIQAVDGQIMNLNFETPTATRNVLIRDRTGSLAFTDEIGTTASGTYTPTLSNTFNVTSTTALTAHYMRVGNEVTVTGRFAAASTSVGTMQVGISLPIASSMTATEDASGMGSSTTTSTFRRVDLYYKVASSTVVLETVTNDTGDNNYRFQFTYTIK